MQESNESTFASARVSAVIPAYNASRYIEETIVSVLKQTLPPVEILVIDDGSTDGTPAIARAFGPPVRAITKQNGGEGSARNRGLDEAAGEFVAFLDADDLWEPTKLEKQVAAMAPGVVACHSTLYNFGEVNTVHDVSQVPEAIRYSVAHIAIYCPIMPSCLMVRADLPCRFPTWTDAGVDVVYCLDLVQHGRVALVCEPLTGYRRFAASMSQAPSFMIRAHRSMERWLAENPDRVTAEEAAEIRRGCLVRCIEHAERAKWMRNWGKYKELRSYLRKYPGVPEVAQFMSERVYPQWVYSIRDRIRPAAMAARTG